MQIDEVIHKIQELREGHNREAMQEILVDLKELRKVLAQEAQEAETAQLEGPSKSPGDPDRLKYRIDHLSKNYHRLFQSGEKEKEELRKEISRLNYRVEILKKHVKLE